MNMNEKATNAGVLLSRRPLLALFAAAGLAPSLRARECFRARDEGESELDFAGFLAEAVPYANDLIGDTSRSGQDCYLHMLAALAVRLREVPVPEMHQTSQDSSARTFLGVNECEAPFTVLHWRMEPGARIGLHPHIYGNVLSLCLEGEIRIQNYEMVGMRDFDTREPFAVRRSNDQILLPGDVNLVNLEHGYVHGFVAGPAGARGLDITTRIRPKRSTPTLIVRDEPTDAGRALFEGHWRHA